MKGILIYDIKKGLYENKYRFLLSGVVIFLICGEFYIKFKRLGQSIDLPNTMDYMIYLFKGVKNSPPSLKMMFDIPIDWLVLNIMPLFLICYYPTTELFTSGYQSILRLRKNVYYFLSKCIWCVLNIAIYYLMCYLIVNIFAILTGGNVSIVPNSDINKLINLIDISTISDTDLILSLYVLPFLTSICIALVQMLLSFIFSSTVSVICVISYLIFSVYYYSPYIIGNYLNFYRNSVVYKSGYNVQVGIIVNCVIMLVVVLLGCFYFKKIDYIK